ncbi:hypothetical protein DV564_10350 [Salmonella enterica]|nr:hypothetical protein [Salmonella enterica]EBX8206154.1 hypothetical protein [Salmonella enterica subsp. enterica serovar Javiana]
MGKITGKIKFTSEISLSIQSPAMPIRCMQGTPLIPRTFSSCCITFRAVPLSCCFYCPYAISPDMPYVQQKVVIGRL